MLVSLANANFGYAADLIFENLSFQVNPGEKLGVVGPNGHGKSTLLRLIAGTLAVETGERSVRRGVEIGYMRQSHEFPHDVSVHDLLMATFPEVLEVERSLAATQARIDGGDHTEATLHEFGDLQHRFEVLDGWTLESRASALAEEVGFGPDDLKRPAGSLSGGERTRFELARVLLRQPDVLLLDEPTNHLDLVQTEKLERRLAEYPSAFLLVSHDRAFLRATCTGIVEVERKRATRYPGGYDAWRRQREERLTRALDEYVRQHERIEKTEEFIRRNIAGQKSKQAMSRRRMLEKLERVERPEDVWEAAKHLGMEFEPGVHPGGREIIRARDVAIGYEGKEPLFRGFDWTLYRGERVGIVGPNGAGKTSLVEALLGRRAPLEGLVELGYQVSPGYLDQKLRSGLDERRSLVDEVRALRPDLTIEGARDALARYRFLGDDVFKAVGGLSGGERCRLALLKISLEPHNLLVLDEPTNHLDIPACEVLERALETYDGTLLVISHDREFLDGVVKKILWVEGGGVRVFEGNWSEARRKMRGEAAEAAAVAAAHEAKEAAKDAAKAAAKAKEAAAAKDPAAKAGVTNRKDPGSKAAAAAAVEPAPAKPGARVRDESKRRRREQQQAKNRLAKLEEEIAQFEARLKELQELLAHPPAGDWAKLHALVNEEQELRGRLDRRYREWERVTEALGRPDSSLG
ncbi:MAG: ABC-F family ATP-binding cassette domain-containing protein [bacterium]